MKRNESIIFYTCGFTDSDIGLISSLRKHLDIVRLSPEEDISSHLHAARPSVFVMNVLSANELNLFRQLRVENPGYCFGVCVDPANTALLSSLVSRDNFVLFLYPLKREDVSVALQKLMQGYLSRQLTLSLRRGLRVLHQAYRWKSRDIEIQAAARHLGMQLDLAGFCDGDSAAESVVLAIEESLVNAVEHGNLGMDSRAKDEDLLGMNYEAERESRMQDDEYGNRTVSIELAIDRDIATLVINNEGPGFDADSEMAKLKGPVAYRTHTSSGKGLYMISRIFDSLSFSNTGRTLTLVKKKKEGTEV